MAAPCTLDGSLHLTPSADTKLEIVEQLWGTDPSSLLSYSAQGNKVAFSFNPYFHHYGEQCSLALHDGGRHATARSHQDVLDIVKHLKGSLSRDAILQILCNNFSTSPPLAAIENAIDLAARLLLMVDVGSLHYGFHGKKQLDWTSGSLKDFIHGSFDRLPTLGLEHVKLERIFKARNLGRIAGLEIKWTSNLADHLRLVDEDEKVAIFHHASFLEMQHSNSLFPDGFVEETLRTLELLFPQSDRETRIWFQKLPSSLNLDRQVIWCGQLRAEDRQIENFRFWHDRLTILKEFFDEAEPTTLLQFWCDRRKGVQWYTFWIAALVLALTIFFGLIECIEGALQVYKAFIPTS